MSGEQMDYAAILANLEAKRAALDATIASIRAAIASGVLGQIGDIPPSSSGGIGSAYSPMMGGNGEIPAGAFLGKSIPDAARLYLEIVKKKQTSKEISEALIKGGMESNSRNFQQIVHSILDRTRKANGGIVKLDRSYWGLASWYPAGLLRTSGAPREKHPALKKKAKRANVNSPRSKPANSGASRPSPTSSAVSIAPEKKAPKPGGIDDRITTYLRTYAPARFGVKDIATALGAPVGVVNFALVRLAKMGLAIREEDGKFGAAA